MHRELADVVHSVIGYALELRDRIRQEEELDLLAEQATLREMLLTGTEISRVADYGPDAATPSIAMTSTGSSKKPATNNNTDGFLGVRYALVCWLDELFVLSSPWSTAWNERKLEVSLYGSNDRAWRFWQQAELARQRTTTDALEAFYLCAMLGFWGELREHPERFQEWTLAARSRLACDPARKWRALPELQPPTYVPPRRGRHRLQRMVLVCGGTLLLLVPIVTFGVITRWS